ncbi:reverse transcriptase [Tanacetum coccineum]
MMTTQVLTLPNFEKEFVVETDASGCGIGDVLHQDGHLIAYPSNPLPHRHQSLSTYEKEFLAVIMALDRFLIRRELRMELLVHFQDVLN